MCYLRGLETEEIQWDELKNALKPVFKRIKGFYIVGAEPFLYKDLYQMVYDLKSMGIKTGIQSNGTIHWFEILDVVDRFDTSIDGPEEIHNRIRGDGSYKKTMTMIEKAIEKRKMGIVSITVMEENIFSVEDTIFKLINSGVKRMDISPVVRWNRPGELIPLMPIGSYSQGFIKDFLGLVNRLKDIPGVTFSPDWLSVMPERFFNAEKVEDFYCGHFNALRIQPDGSVVHCQHIRRVFGNVLKEDVLRLWYGQMRSFREELLKRNLYRFCRRCCRSEWL